MAGPFGRAYLWGAALGDCLHLLLLAAWYLGVSCLLSENRGFLSIECGHGIAVDYRNGSFHFFFKGELYSQAILYGTLLEETCI